MVVDVVVEATTVVTVVNKPSTNPGRVDFETLVDAMTLEERKKHMDEGLCFKCHKRGHRLFKCPEWKGKAPMEVQQSKKQ
jgi:CRISPR/Cas system-associated protein Cas7 (RAMP superfamily)